MRFLVASSVVIAGIAACSSFGTDTANTPTATPDASGSTSSSGASPIDSGSPSEFSCPTGVAFCDDFKRADAGNVKGEWSDLVVNKPTEDPPAKIENDAFHLFAANASTEDARTFLYRTLENCEGARISVQFDFKLSSPRRHSNLSVITIEHEGKSTYVSLALDLDNTPRLELAINDNDTAHDPGAKSDVPLDGVWTRVEYVLDLKLPAIALSINGTLQPPTKTIAARTGITGCRFSIGNDYIDVGDASERWYDNVVATVVKP